MTEDRKTVTDGPAFEAAMAQIDRAFGKGSVRARDGEDDDLPELTPEEEAAEAERQARWNAMTKEEQDASWAEWEAENFPGRPPF